MCMFQKTDSSLSHHPKPSQLTMRHLLAEIYTFSILHTIEFMRRQDICRKWTRRNFCLSLTTNLSFRRLNSPKAKFQKFVSSPRQTGNSNSYSVLNRFGLARLLNKKHCQSRHIVLSLDNLFLVRKPFKLSNISTCSYESKVGLTFY